jgi:DNA-3-methyladenine glycosylase I
MTKRCGWCLTSERMIAYHDAEWGVPLHDDRKLFELLVLGGFQAGLSWSTILNRREGFRAAFDGFDPEKVARYGQRQVGRLLRDAGIIRNRQKIAAAVGNARALLEVRRECGSFDAFVWGFVGGRPRRNRRRTLAELPATSPESDEMSRVLRARGFRFAGSTICYAFMQSAGLVNDHLTTCFRHREIRRLACG